MKKNLILDAGSGHHPWIHADVLCDRFVGSTHHRSAANLPAKRDTRPFVCCDIQDLPFKTASFRLVYSYHVLEHTENPTLALNELKRVAKRGYVVVPTFFSEIFFGSNPGHHYIINKQGETSLNINKGFIGGIKKVVRRFLRYNYNIKLRERILRIIPYMGEHVVQW